MSCPAVMQAAAATLPLVIGLPPEQRHIQWISDMSKVLWAIAELIRVAFAVKLVVGKPSGTPSFI